MSEEFDEKAAEKSSKKHCWPSDSISDVYESGFVNGANWQHQQSREEIDKLKAENKRLREALKYYSETGRHFGSNDGGKVADIALAIGEKE